MEIIQKDRQSLFSILLPVYNNKEDILNAISSVVEQTYKHWELIIIDDCSTDGTYELIYEFVNNNTYNIILLRNDRNKGVYVSLNEGLLVAKGKYIARIDSDDMFDNTMLEKNVNVFNTEKCLIVQSKYKRDDKESEYGEITLVYDKKIIDEIGFYDSVRFAADSEFIERIIRYYGKDKIVRIDEVLYYAKNRINSLTTSDDTGFYKEGKVKRINYVKKYREWHKLKYVYMKYPLIKRPFKVDPTMLP